MTAGKQRVLHPSFRRCRDYLIAAAPLVGLSVYLYGLRPLIMVALACAVAFLCDLANAGMRHTQYDVSDLSSLLFVIVFTLMLPASAPYYVVLVGALFVVMLGKHAFGGYECYPFSPPAFGFAFVSICWKEQVFRYPMPFSSVGLGWTSGAALYDAPAHALKYGGIPYVETNDLILGNYAGPMGATFCLIILAALLLLIEHRTVTGHVSISFILTCAAFSFAFPRIQATRLESVMYEMLSGVIVFAAVFMASEPSVAPKKGVAKIIFGVTLGLATMIMRYFGVFEMGFCFALLIISPLAGYLDRKLVARVKPAPEKEDAEDA